jgi:hypothetical protein
MKETISTKKKTTTAHVYTKKYITTLKKHYSK